MRKIDWEVDELSEDIEVARWMPDPLKAEDLIKAGFIPLPVIASLPDSMKIALARSEGLPADIAMQFAREADLSVCRALATNPGLTEAVSLTLARSVDSVTRYFLLECQESPYPSVVDLLVLDSEPLIRVMCLEFDLRDEQKDLLKDDPDTRVALRAVDRFGCDIPSARRFLSREPIALQGLLCRDLDLSELEPFLNSEDALVRYYAWSNPGVGTQRLEQRVVELSNDRDAFQAIALARNPEISPRTLHWLKEIFESSNEVLLAVALSENSSFSLSDEIVDALPAELQIEVVRRGCLSLRKLTSLAEKNYRSWLGTDESDLYLAVLEKLSEVHQESQFSDPFSEFSSSLLLSGRLLDTVIDDD